MAHPASRGSERRSGEDSFLVSMPFLLGQVHVLVTAADTIAPKPFLADAVDEYNELDELAIAI